MQDNYNLLLSVYERLLEKLQVGERLCDVYNAAVSFIEEKRPELKDHFSRNAGYVLVHVYMYAFTVYMYHEMVRTVTHAHTHTVLQLV